MGTETEDNEKAIGRIRKAISFRLARLNVLLNAQAVRALQTSSDLSLNEWRVFYLVHNLQPVTPRGLSGPAAMDPSLISRGVTSLMEKGLLSATRSADDQRKRLLRLSDAGEELMSKLGPVMAARRAKMDAQLTEEEHLMLDRIIQKLEQQANPEED